jgi:hypothetical protein
MNTSTNNTLRTPTYDTSGFVAVDRTNKLIVVSFRGTENCNVFTGDLSGNCQANLQSLTLQNSDFCNGCMIAPGYLSAWNEVRDNVIQAVRGANITNNGFRVLSTGHSLGGALSTVAALELRRQGFTVDLVSYIFCIGGDNFPTRLLISLNVGLVRSSSPCKRGAGKLHQLTGFAGE